MRSSIPSRITLLLAIAVSFAAMPAGAVDFVTYTDKAAFLAAVNDSATDTFNDLPDGLVFGPLNRTIGSYSYTATAFNEFFPNGTAEDRWLSTNNSSTPIDFTTTGGSPTAMGGFFFVTDRFGSLAGSTVSVSINGGLFQQSISTSSPTNFFGWVSTNGTPITSFQVSAPGLFPDVNDLILAQAVPEPSTWALGTLAAITLGIASRRKAKRGSRTASA